MNQIEIKQKLDELEELRAAVDVLEMQRQDLIDSVLGTELKGKLAEIDAEFSGKAEEARSKADALEGEVKLAVIALGETVKSTVYQAVWNKGRVSWDSSKLEGFAIAHPEILVARKVGEPSVTLRKVG